MTDSYDRPELPLPARRTPAPPPAPPAEFDDHFHEPPAGAAKSVSARLVWRALRRHWWQAAILWIVGSVGLASLAYFKIKPSFDAISQVSVELGDMKIFANGSAPIDYGQFMKTQVAMITSPKVITTALAAHPEIQGFPLLRASNDPEVEIRQALRVAPVPGTSLIQIEMSSQIPAEAAEIVNAVVESYLKQATESYDRSTAFRIEKLEAYHKTQQDVVENQRKAVKKMVDELGQANLKAAENVNNVSVEAYRQYSEQLTQVEIMRIASKSKLDQLRNEKVVPARAQDENEIKAAVSEAFYADPRVDSLQTLINQTQGKLDDAKRLSRNPNDPSVARHRLRLKDLEDKKNDLWVRLEKNIRRQITAVPVDDTVDKMIRDAEANLAATTTQEEALRANLKKLRIENKVAEGQALQLEYARRDLQRHETVFETINNNLTQLKFEAQNPTARVNEVHKARPSNRPNADRRTQIMAAAPVGMFFMVLALLVLLELRGARVGDPEELTARVRLQVLGVVPPLPQIRVNSGGGSGYGNGTGPPATQSEFRAQRELDEFVQSLDHLRVTLCARKDPWGRDRHCVLITSACGSEGKTTLAAQLAERCVNAGMMTLLIDADLRNPTLSRMLDAVENPGLINVLRGEMIAEDVITVIGDAGGFHLLPAGTPRMDPSRLLESDRLGQLIAQARESFDMIIVDAPPVLPVPDALTIGKWTDGAVLAVRYDTSRFPLVERANRKLAHVGVPVLGAVVNGVRSVESSYGGYAYGGSYGSVGPEPSAAVPSEKTVAMGE